MADEDTSSNSPPGFHEDERQDPQSRSPHPSQPVDEQIAQSSVTDPITSTNLRMPTTNVQVRVSRPLFQNSIEVELHNAVVSALTRIMALMSNHWSLATLAALFFARFRRGGKLVDVDAAITLQQWSIDLAPEDYIDKAEYLRDLGNFSQARFERLGELADLDRAISIHLQSLELTPEGHANKAMYLNNLGNSFQARFERLGELADIDRAIDAQQQSVELTPDGRADKAGRLHNLGNSFQARFECLGELTDMDNAICAFRTGAEDPSGPLSLRFYAARRWVRLVSSEDPSALPTVDAHKVVMELIPQVVWIGSHFHRRYEQLPSIATAVNEAAAAAMAAGDPALALEWLEEGRCIVICPQWAQMLQLRTPLDDLRNVEPKLADELERVSRELENAGATGGLGHGAADQELSLEGEALRHRRLAERYETLVEQARALPGCERFLRPKRVADLRRASGSGPVVILNVHTQRCDALILHHASDEVIHIPLPALNHTEVARWQALMLQSLQKSGIRARGTRPVFTTADEMSDILAKLWSSVVEPVLLELKLLGQQPANDSMPHITWCATGPLAFLPLHAAGIYAHATAQEDRKSLLETSPRHRASIPSVLSVSQPSTPGQNSLPGAVTEIAAVKECVGNLGFFPLSGEQATKDAVLKAMAEHTWVHLACHAEQHLRDPMKSAFLLHDGRLGFMDIMKKSFKHTELAVLSACQTATGAVKLPEEAVHLAAGMLVAGYPSVVATMWSIQDRDAPIVMKVLYSHLMKEDRGDGRKVAYALHAAVKCLRDKVGEKEFVRWVPFVHIGV